MSGLPRRLLRILATGTGFIVFGLGCLVMLGLVCPLILLASRDPVVRRRAMRRAIGGMFRFFIHFMHSLGLFTFNLEGFRQLPAGSIILANHPTLIDVVFLLGWMPNAACVIKGPLTRNIFTAGPVALAGYISNEEDDLLAQCTAELLEGPLLIFAEGTRSTPGRKLRFMRGAAHLALQTGARIYPVTVAVHPVSLVKGQSWWDVPDETSHFTIVMHAPWSAERYQKAHPRPTMQARLLNADLTQFFGNELAGQGEPATDNPLQLDYNSRQG